MIKHIPNTITCLNLFSGCIACILAFRGFYDWALIAIIIASVFDFADGFAARWLKAYSMIGKELDSLADMISFGMAPGIIIFSYLSSFPTESLFIPFTSYLSYLAFLIPVFSALRLAKFNIDERQTNDFLGLPTPADALFWGSAIYGIHTLIPEKTIAIYVILLIAIILFSLMMISEIRMFSLKFKHFGWKGNEIRYVLIILSIALIAEWNLIGISGCILLYIVLSLLSNASKKKG